MRVKVCDCAAIGETEKALLVSVDGEEVWIPKSQIDDDSEVYMKGNVGDLIIPEWLARDKDLEGEEYEG